MPGLKALGDGDSADVATYVRGEWENEASQVDVGTVQRIRALESGRSVPWTERELLNLREGG